LLSWLLDKFTTTGPAHKGAVRSKAAVLKEIHRLEEAGDPADAITIARLWNRLGTMSETDGDGGAMGHFGKAVDAYLEAGYFDAAAAMCHRMIRLHPEVVRARCTLAFLSIGRRDLGDAIQEITEYTMASKRTGTERYAIPRLRLMAEATSDSSVLGRIASALAELGDAEGRDEVHERMHNPPALEDGEDGDKRWERLLAVALLDRQQLRRQAAPPPELPAESVWEASSVWEAA